MAPRRCLGKWSSRPKLIVKGEAGEGGGTHESSFTISGCARMANYA